LELLHGLETDGRFRAHHLAAGFSQNRMVQRLLSIPMRLTLVIGGARDYFYSPEMFAETVRLMPRGKAIVYPKRGHNIVTSTQFAADATSFLEQPEA
jgi:hypothetical protein